MSGTPSMPRSGPGMSDSELGRINVSLGMLDANSILAAQALHGAIQAACCRISAHVALTWRASTQSSMLQTASPFLQGPCYNYFLFCALWCSHALMFSHRLVQHHTQSYDLPAQSACAGWQGQLQDTNTLRALQQNLQQQLRQPSESPMHPSGAQFPTSSSLFNTNPYAPSSSQPRHTHNLSQYGNPSHKPPPPDLRPPHVQQPHTSPSNPTSAPSQAAFGINALGNSLLNLNNPLSGLSALQPSGTGGHTDIAALMATPQSGQDLQSQQQFPSGFGQHAGGPSPASQFAPSGQMPGFGPGGGTQAPLRPSPGDLSMATVAAGPSEQRLGGPGGMAGMLSGSGGSGSAHDFRQQISTGFGAGSLGQHGVGGASAGIASLASLLGNIVPTDPRGDQGGGVEITPAGPEGGVPGGRGSAGSFLDAGGAGARGTPRHVCDADFAVVAVVSLLIAVFGVAAAGCSPPLYTASWGGLHPDKE